MVDGVRAAVSVPLAVAGAGAACVVYGWRYELRAFRLREAEAPVLPRGADPVRVLHISDAHLTPTQRWKVEWVRSLAALQPDFVVNTGDSLAHPDAVAPMLEALEPLLGIPGAFVPGSNDYFAPRWKNPARYLLPDDGKRVHGDPLPYRELRDAMAAAGWTDCAHTRSTVKIGPLEVELAGVDDPHIKQDRYDRIAGPVAGGVDLALGLVHSPEPRVLERFAADGFDLVLCGHTHGGQLRVPGYGALVTNCGLDTRRARGLSRWDDGRMWLQVSAGLGTSPFAPVRFACPPEATLLTLTPRLD